MVLYLSVGTAAPGGALGGIARSLFARVFEPENQRSEFVREIQGWRDCSEPRRGGKHYVGTRDLLLGWRESQSGLTSCTVFGKARAGDDCPARFRYDAFAPLNPLLLLRLREMGNRCKPIESGNAAVCLPRR